MKKFLSMALALVMTMSLVVVGSSAAFTDNSSIEYKEAVSVISACGIIDGYTDGSFNPTGTLTRGAAAKIICNMILGPTTADALSADAAPFKDVPANHVFAGYIAYCAQQGIINGYADGTFKPAGTVTGYQFMKMLLGALGYEGKYEGFTGANWSIQVAKLALNLELEDGNDNFVGTKALTREEACLYAFNTLKATMVEYEENTQITVGDVVINTTSKAKEVESGNKAGIKIWDTKTLQFAEKYFTKLDAQDKADSFGRPGTKWLYDGESVGTFANAADEEYVLVKTGVTLKEALLDTDYMNLDEDDFVENDDDEMDPVVYLNGKSGIVALGDKLNAGDKIEVFEETVDDDDVFTTVVIIRYSVAEIDEVNDELSTADTKKGASYAVELKALGEFNLEADATLYDKHDDKAEIKGFNAKTYTEGTVLAIVASEKDDDVLASNVAESVTGKVTVYKSGAKAAITVDGTAYPMTGAAAAQADTNFDFDGDEYTIYLDPNGYVIGIDGDNTAALEDVYYVTEIGHDTGKYENSTVDYAQAVSLKDGTVAEFKLDKDEQNKYPTPGYLYSFDEDDGKYTAVLYEGTDDIDVDYDDASIDLARDDSNMKLGSTKFYFEDDTAFLKIEDSGADIDVKTATGSTSVDATNARIVVVSEKNGSTRSALHVVIAATEINNSMSAEDVIYFSDNPNRKNADGRVGEVYFMDGTGTVEDITFDNKASENLEGRYFKFTVDDDGIYTLKTELEDLTETLDEYKDETGFVDGTLTRLYKGALTVSVNGYVFADDVDLSSNVVIIDEREDDERDADMYKSEITTATRLQNAIDKDGVTVTATVFFDDEEVIFVAVRTVTDAEQ
ncbi:S-layer homology domain-containing protein [Dysosmobacter sp.]|uniref:S-layer homology domain-containing protein n=1 Tax=Dysosmobacter sp. TaxID=2591382 RepID=UPI002A85DE11|nr:S-layer homology domain-containing protein [Dysosmobacter sp.]MDY3281676.1 S-layer homology domain-containing protein [Dysosmobacter sp.]